MANENLEWALREFNSALRLPTRTDITSYRLYRRYYEGDHNLNFATDRFQEVFGAKFQAIRDNLCPAVVDSLAERLRVVGFTSKDARSSEQRISELIKSGLADPTARRAWEIWQDNQLDARSTEVHRESFMTGDGYVIVWPHPETLQPTVWPQYADQMAIEYDTTTPGRVARAAKIWREPKSWRLNIYLPDRTEKYVHEANDASLFQKLRDALQRGLDPTKRWQALSTDMHPDGVVDNPYGRVPVFHFPNKRMFALGISELEDVIPLQDALNKTMCDQLVAQEFTSFRQRWVAGIDVEVDPDTGAVKAPPFQAGADKIFAASDPATSFGEFGASDLSQFLDVEDNLRAEIARVSGVPLHYFFISKSDFPSGEAMKSAEARFTKKTVDKQDSFGDGWEAVISFALQIDGTEIPETFTLSSVWENAAPRSDEEIARTLLLKARLGVSRKQLLKEAGYSDDLIAEMLAEDPNPSLAALGPEPPAPSHLSAVPAAPAG